MLERFQALVVQENLPWAGPIDRSQVLWVAVDISKSWHTACLGTEEKVLRKKLRFANRKEGLDHLESSVLRLQKDSRFVIFGMEPSGPYWKPLFSQLRLRGHAVVLVHSKAVKHNRETLGENNSKTDPKDAYAIYDLLRQGKFFLPIQREPELECAYRLMQHYEDSRKRTGQIRNQLRSTLSLAFPELNDRIKKLHGKSALRFLSRNPTPDSILRLEREEFLQRWRGPHGRWGRRFFTEIYDLAERSIGLRDPQDSFCHEIRLLSQEFQRLLAVQEQWFQQALALVRDHPHFHLLQTLPGVGEKLAVGLLASLADPRFFHCAKQWVRLAGLDLRQYRSGESVRKGPRISRQGRVLLRHWLYQASLQATRHEGPFRALYQRRLHNSPGRGARGRARIAVCDKLVRVLFGMLRDQRPYEPEYDQQTEALYRSHTTASQRSQLHRPQRQAA